MFLLRWIRFVERLPGPGTKLGAGSFILATNLPDTFLLDAGNWINPYSFTAWRVLPNSKAPGASTWQADNSLNCVIFPDDCKVS